MRVLLQRVSQASVAVAGQTVGRIGPGVTLLVGVGHGDGQAEATLLAQKIAHCRIFTDEAGKMNLSLLDVQGGALVVSQFTLFADTRKGRRPSFTGAAPPDQARELVDFFARELTSLGVSPVQQGVFGAHMLVEIHNDGPVTLWLDSAELAKSGG